MQEDFPLKQFNTFAINVSAKYFSTFKSVDGLLRQLPAAGKLPVFILGGGSNILFTKNFEGMVLKNEIMGIDTVHEDEDYVYIKAGAGEVWHHFVLHCINRNLSGAENLSLIPGSVGASPMQNIGAYGAELKDIFYSLEAYSLTEKRIINFTLNDCGFGYRESVFKTKYKSEFIILHVTFRLSKKPAFNISYGSLQEELEKMNVSELSVQAISKAVINIRKAKLPDPAIIGNAGSFFKNPEITKRKLQGLQFDFPRIVFYPLDNGNVKLAAGWLIEQCGWKGYRKGDAGCHKDQALVLVNYGNASGKEIYALSANIKRSVMEKFAVKLDREVNTI